MMSHSFRNRMIAVAVAAGLLIAGCSASDPDHTPAQSGLADLPPLTELDLAENPRDWVGPSTALLPSTAVPVLANPDTPELPVTVSSRDPGGDREVTVESADRILALSMTGNLAATVVGLGLGDRLVGRDVVTAFPGTEDLPVVTKAGHAISVEAVLDLAPDVVIVDGSVGPLDVVLQLRDAGITLVFVDRDASLEGTYRVTEQVAQALGVPEAGTRLSDQIRDEVEGVLDQISQIAPQDPDDKVRMVFLYVRGASNIYYLFGTESGADTVIDALGGVDIATEMGWEGMRPVTDEALIDLDPDLILMMTDGLKSVEGVDGLMEYLPPVALTKAGKNRRIVDMADTVILSFGPRSAAVLDSLARAIYAPADPSVVGSP